MQANSWEANSSSVVDQGNLLYFTEPEALL
jgi:hypothetical protein